MDKSLILTYVVVYLAAIVALQVFNPGFVRQKEENCKCAPQFKKVMIYSIAPLALLGISQHLYNKFSASKTSQ